VRKLLVEIVTGIIHVVYGLITSYTSFFNPLLSIFFFSTYLIYQIVDFFSEPDIQELKGDIVEYCVGLVVGLILKII
jgi:hypothetical protein